MLQPPVWVTEISKGILLKITIDNLINVFAIRCFILVENIKKVN